ncbi:putative GGDEF domain-containing protein [Ruminococcaceae bacterium BL-4]|nr:putative GGDEF domain-containing protein [Ruminococcaceae bacterium BL-4]
MFSVTYLCICIYCMLQLSFLLAMEHCRRNVQTSQEKHFIHMLILTLVSFAGDIASNFSSAPDWFFPFTVLGVYVELIFNTALIPIFFLYVCTQISKLDSLLKRKVKLILLGFDFLCTATVLSTAFTGQIFNFDSLHVYHRGPLLFIPMTIQLIMMIIVEGFLISQRRQIEANYFSALSVFLVTPLIGWALQLFIYGLPFSLLSITFAAQIMFTDIQNHNMDKDYLTGAFTREILDNYMQHKIDASTNQKTFAAILLDIDDFKSINDGFGHFEGDVALKKTVSILRNSVDCHDFVARYGGDEFCVVFESDDGRTIENTITRIKDNLASYNQSINKPYKLSFSMGYAVYSRAMGDSTESFFKLIDRKMYEQKNLCKVASSIAKSD